MRTCHSGARTTEVEVATHVMSLRRSVAAGAVGVFVHWFDWAAYAYLAGTVATVFFPAEDSTTGLLAVFGVFAVSFGIRPIGALVFGSLGDRIGRKRTLSLVIFMMSGATLTIGLLPGYASIGVAAPILLVILRLLQGFAAGGEFGSAASFLAESAPRRRRGFGVSWLEVGSLLGFLAGSFVFFLLSTTLDDSRLTSWGWRLPFLIAAPLGVIGFIIRNKIEDTPEYRAMEANDTVPRSPVRELLRSHKRHLLQAFGLMAAMHVPFYAVLTYLVTYETDHLGHSADSAALLSTVISLLGLVLVPLFGLLSDRVGRKPVFVGATAALLVVSTPAFLLMRAGTAGTWARPAAGHDPGGDPRHLRGLVGRGLPHPHTSERAVHLLQPHRRPVRGHSAVPDDRPHLRHRQHPGTRPVPDGVRRRWPHRRPVPAGDRRLHPAAPRGHL